MAKEKKRSYKCGNCGNEGHNARKCPAKAEAAAAKLAKSTQKDEVVTENKDEEKETKSEHVATDNIAISQTSDLTSDHRKVATRPARPPSPFDCPTCLRVGILVLVETGDGKQKMCCEYCQTKSRPTRILKWGALPEDKPADGSPNMNKWGIMSKPADA